MAVWTQKSKILYTTVTSVSIDVIYVKRERFSIPHRCDFALTTNIRNCRLDERFTKHSPFEHHTIFQNIINRI